MELRFRYASQRHPILAVGAVIVRENNILLVKRRNPPYAGAWTIPGGKVNWGETTRSALIREVKEECGLEVVPGRILDVVDHIEGSPNQIEIHYTIVDFHVTSFTGELNAGSDAADARWVDRDGLNDIEIPDFTRYFLEKHEVFCTVRGQRI